MRGRRPNVPKTRQRSKGGGGGWPEEVRVVARAGCQHYAALVERTEEEGGGWFEEVGVAELASRFASALGKRTETGKEDGSREREHRTGCSLAKEHEKIVKRPLMLVERLERKLRHCRPQLRASCFIVHAQPDKGVDVCTQKQGRYRSLVTASSRLSSCIPARQRGRDVMAERRGNADQGHHI